MNYKSKTRSALKSAALLSVSMLMVSACSSGDDDDLYEGIPAERVAAHKAQLAAEAADAAYEAAYGPSPSPSPSSASKFDNTRALTICDLNMQSMAISQRSYKSSWSPKTQINNGVVVIRRDFTVKNAYGTEMSGNYECMLGESTGIIMGIRYTVAGNTTIVEGSQLSQN